MESLKLFLLGFAAPVVYGIVQDQVTVRVCPEYFTIGHPLVFATTNPTLLALGWGVLATWWMGAILGTLLAVVGRMGSRPKLCAHAMVSPIAMLMGIVAVLTITAGFLGCLASEMGWVRLVGDLAERVPRGRHSLFLANLWAHLVAYTAGFLGGGILLFLTWRNRGRANVVRRQR